VQVDDFAVGEVLFQGREVSIGDSMRLFRQLLDVAQGGLFLRSEAGDIAFLESLPVVGGESGSLRRSEMVLRSIVALIEKRHAQIDELVEFAVERASHAGVEGEKVLEQLGTVSQSFLKVSRLAFKGFFVDVFHFTGGLGGFDQSDA
jgi:hypothetical protein